MSEKHPYGSGSHAPLDDPNEMPSCYPIKGNDDSMKYHRPDSRSYGATIAEVWFISPAHAEAAGFALAGSHPKDSSSADFEPGTDGHPCTAAQVSDMGVGPIVHPYGPGSHVPLEDVRAMPDCYPIKGNVDSMLYHRPDSANYGATIAEVWFVSPSAADAAGFSLSSTHPKDSSSADFELGSSGHPCTAEQFAALSTAGSDSASGSGSGSSNGASSASEAADAAEEAAAKNGGAGAAAAVAGVAGAGAGVAALADLGDDDETVARDDAADIRETAKMAKADAAANADETVRIDKAAAAKAATADAANEGKAAAADAASAGKAAVADAAGAKASAGGESGAGKSGAGKAAAAGAAGVAAAGAAAGSGAGDGGSGDGGSGGAGDGGSGDGDDMHPFGPGSHAPFDDVHQMPECHPIKGNADSMKYHRPDSQGYPKTKAEVWFVSPSVAEAAGFVLAGSHPDGSSSADFEPGGSGHPCSAAEIDGLGLPGGGAAVAAAGAVGIAAAAGSDAFDADETVVMPAANADAFDADDTVVMPAAASADDQPYGLGSRAPLADVHEMPACHPIKGNADSMKYHRPDSQGYQQTKAEVWFVSPSVAEAAGFALAGSHPDGSSSADFEPGASGHPCTADQLNGLGLGALGFAAAGVGAAAVAGAGQDDVAEVDLDADDTEGMGDGAKVAAAAAGVAAVAGAAALLGDDDETESRAAADAKAAEEKAAADAKAAADKKAAEAQAAAEAKAAEQKAAAEAKAAADKKAAEEKAAAEAKAAEQKAAADAKAAADKKAADAKAAAEAKAAEAKAAADAKAAEAEDGMSGKGVAAAAAGAAAVAGAAALLGRDDDDDETVGAGDDDVTKPAGDARATLRNAGQGARETIKETADGGIGKAAVAAGAVGAAGAAGAAKVAGGRGGGDDDDDDGGILAAAGGGGSLGWLKWLLPLLLLLGLLALLFWACSGGSDDDGGDISAAPDPTAVPAATATSEPDPTATPEPDPTATPEPDPTATPEPEPTATPEPTAVPAPSCASLVSTLEDNNFNRLITAATAADIAGALSDSGPLTLFAPTDDAFGAVPEDIVDALLADTDLLAQVLQYHVVPGAVTSGDLAPSSVQTLNGSSLAIRTDGAAPTINASGITVADLAADECVVHGLNSVLVPPSLLSTFGVGSLNAAVGGEAIQFADGTADFTDADAATMAAICNLVSTEDSIDGLPPVKWQSSGDTELDAQRAAAIEDALASCGPGGYATDALAPEPSFTG